MTIILGGGITGLAAAYYALRNPKIKSITLLEASNRLGGWIQSKKLPDGTIFDQGPRTLRLFGKAGNNTLDLMNDLKLSDKLIPIPIDSPVMKNKLIYMHRHLANYRIPVLYMLINNFKAKRIQKEDESVYSFAERRLGTDVAEGLSCMICGIYGGDAHQISVKYFMKNLFEAEQKYGSVLFGAIMLGLPNIFQRSDVGKSDLAKMAIKKKWSALAIKGGMEELPNALTNYLYEQPNVNIKKEHKCERIKFTPHGVELLVNGETMKSPQIVSSLPPKNLANLIHDEHPQLAQELNDIPMVTIGLVNLKFNKTVLPKPAFGVLVSPTEGIPILGVIYDSCIYQQESHTVLTVMMGGAWFKKYFGNSPSKQELLKTATDHVKKILDIKDNPSETNVAILRDCIPQYVVGHEQRLNRINEYISGHGIPLVLCGSFYGGVGVNDTILSAKEAISKIT